MFIFSVIMDACHVLYCQQIKAELHAPLRLFFGLFYVVMYTAVLQNLNHEQTVLADLTYFSNEEWER